MGVELNKCLITFYDLPKIEKWALTLSGTCTYVSPLFERAGCGDFFIEYQCANLGLLWVCKGFIFKMLAHCAHEWRNIDIQTQIVYIASSLKTLKNEEKKRPLWFHTRHPWKSYPNLKEIAIRHLYPFDTRQIKPSFMDMGRQNTLRRSGTRSHRRKKPISNDRLEEESNSQKITAINFITQTVFDIIIDPLN